MKIFMPFVFAITSILAGALAADVNKQSLRGNDDIKVEPNEMERKLDDGRFVIYSTATPTNQNVVAYNYSSGPKNIDEME